MSDMYKQTAVGEDKPITVPESRTYRGISTVDPTSTDWGRYDIAIIKQDLINHFHIRQGEKLNNPSFGTIIWDVLYEPLTEPLKKLIVDDVSRIVNHDPRIRVESILVEPVEHGITVFCTLTFLPYNISERMRFQFDENSNVLK